MKKLICSLIFIALATNTSCLKKQNLEDEDLGPAIEPQSLQSAMLEGFGSLNYSAISANEFSSYVMTQKIQDSYVSTLEQQDMTIESSTDTADMLSINLILSKIKYSGGQSSQSSPRKWEINFSKSGGTTQSLKTLADNDPPVFLFVDFQAIAFGACYNEGKNPQTCHNLSVTDIQYKVPQPAIAQHNCSDPDTCFVNARKIEFDTIYLSSIDKDGKPRRVHYTFVLSKELPYLSRVIKYCSRTLYEISNTNQKILADICYDVNNYTFGGTQK